MSETPDQCYPREVIVSCMRGQLDGDTARSVLDHMGRCTVCASTADTVGPEDDPLLKQLSRSSRHQSEQGHSSGKVANLIARVSRLQYSRQPIHIPGYQIQGRIGRGGMGDVWKAIELASGIQVAIKLIASNLQTDWEIEHRFKKEATALQAFDTEHVVRFRDFGSHEGNMFLVMDWAEGADLKEVLAEEGPLPVQLACKLIRQACTGLSAIHKAGLVHRDIKPANLVMSPAGNLQIVDFGLVRDTNSDTQHSQFTCAGQVLGTLDYIAPEQIRGQEEISPSADIYAAGCTFYELLTGAPPFKEHVSNWDKGSAHLQGEFPDVRRIRPDTPEYVADLIGDMTRLKQSERPSAEQVVELLSNTTTTETKNRLTSIKKIAALAASLMFCIVAASSVSLHLNKQHAERSESTKPMVERIDTREIQWSDGNFDPEFSGVVSRPANLKGVARWQVYTKTPQASASAIQWSHSGDQIAILAYDGKTRLYTVAGDRLDLLQVFPNGRRMIERGLLSFSHDDRLVAIANEQSSEIEIWEVITRKAEHYRLVGRIQLPNAAAAHPTALAWHPKLNRLAAATNLGESEHSVMVWDLARDGVDTLVFQRTAHSETICGIAWNGTGDLLFSAGADSWVRSWNVAKQSESASHKLSGPATAIAISPSSAKLVVADREGHLSIYNSSLEESHTIRFDHETVSRVDFVNEDAILLSGLQIWKCDLNSDSVQSFVNPGNNTPVVTSYCRPGSRGLAVADPYLNIDVYPPDGSKPKALIAEGDLRVACIAPHPRSSEQWVIGLCDGTVRSWNARNGKTSTIAQHDHCIGDIAFSPDGKKLASSDYWNGNGIQISKPNENGAQRIWLFDHTKEVPAIAWSPDSVWIASVSFDGSARVANTIAYDQVSMPPLHTGDTPLRAIAFRSDGGRLAFGGDDSVVYLHTGALDGFARLDEIPVPGAIESLAWSPDGQEIAVSVMHNSEILILDSETGNVLRRTTAPHRNYGLKWSGDRRFVFSGTFGLLHATSLQPLESQIGKYGAFSADSKRGAFAGRYSPIQQFDLASMEFNRCWVPTRESGATFSTSGMPSASTLESLMDTFYCLVDDGTEELKLIPSAQFYERFLEETK